MRLLVPIAAGCLAGVVACSGGDSSSGSSRSDGSAATARSAAASPLGGLTSGRSPLGCDDPAPEATDDASFAVRDLQNMLCATERTYDQYANPAAFLKFAVEDSPRTIVDNLLDQLAEPTRPRLSLGQLIPGATNADPYRIPEDWQAAGRGRALEISFIATDGAKLVGRIFTPNPSPGGGKLPGIVITTGSIQGYQELYYWAAEGLAEAGYMVLSYDVQGQGRSETLPHLPDGTPTCCAGVPFQQSYNFTQGTRDALDFLLSTPSAPYPHGVGGNAAGTNFHNPLWADLDRARLGIAGHSLGASAVSVVGQSYPGISAIVGWDALATIGKDAKGNLIDDLGHAVGLHVPAISITADYFLNPTPTFAASLPADDKIAAYRQLKDAGVDAMRVALRSSTHLEFSYIPYILPASRYGERVSMYYTLAWFDRYVKGEGAATTRLTARTFDDSADRSSIGAGRFDVAKLAPGVPGADGNVPYEIAGACIADRLSLYYRSAYALVGGVETVDDMRARGCP